MPSRTSSYLLTTQPGWDSATVAELRARGVSGRFPVYHRGSSVLVSGLPRTSPAELTTPATTYRVLLEARAAGRRDAASRLLAAVRPAAIKEQSIQALLTGSRRGLRRYAISCEVYGRTEVSRPRLAGAIDTAVATAFPRWKRAPEAGARFLCKADPEYAVLALQVATNLSGDHGLRAGSLREHLAAGLLTLAHLAPGSTVFDPFMGTGTILKVAAQRFGARRCIGLEVSRDAFQVARGRLAGVSVALFNTRLDQFDVGHLPAASRLVANVPFGQRFARVPTRQLVALIQGRPFAAGHVALLMARDQAQAVAAATRLRVRNVLVLGQPAAILHGAPGARL